MNMFLYIVEIIIAFQVLIHLLLYLRSKNREYYSLKEEKLPITSFSSSLQAVKSIISSHKCFPKNYSFVPFLFFFWCSLSFISCLSSFMPLTLPSVEYYRYQVHLMIYGELFFHSHTKQPSLLECGSQDLVDIWCIF